MDLWVIMVITGIVAAFVSALLGYAVVPWLRKLKFGQTILEIGPKWHKEKKQGTPTMGGIMFILGSGLAVLLLGWKQMLSGEFGHLYVYFFALIFGLIGFVDDYQKVRQHQNEGLTAKQKFVLQKRKKMLVFVAWRKRLKLSRNSK